MTKLYILLIVVLVPILAAAQSRSHYEKYVDLYERKSIVISPGFEEKHEAQRTDDRFKGQVPRLYREEVVIVGKGKKATEKIEQVPVQFNEIRGDTLLVQSISPTKTQELTYSYYPIYLNSISTGDLFILKYNDRAWYDFAFDVIEPLSIPEGYFCNEMRTTTNEFTNETTTRSPAGEDMALIKTEKEGHSFKMLYFHTYSSSPNSLSSKKVIILLENGETLNFESEVDVDVNRSSSGFSSLDYDVTSIVTLTDEQIAKLKSIPIKGFRLGYDEEMIQPFTGIKFQNYFRCLF